MKAQTEKMLENGIIRDRERESNSPWSAPAILVRKKAQMEDQKSDFV